MEFDELKSVFEEHLDFEDDPDLLRILFSAICANFYQGKPIWLMLVGDAGSGKTQLLTTLKQCDVGLYTDSISSKALVAQNGKQSEFFSRLDNRILIIKDMSTLSEMGKEDRGELFSILRSAYDGDVSRTTGRGHVIFKGKFGILAAATKSIEQVRGTESLLGERFLYLRPRMKSSDRILARVQKNAMMTKAIDDILQAKVAEFINGWKPPVGKRLLPRCVVDLAKEMAKLLCACRSGVQRDHYTKEISAPVEVTEMPTRIYGQLILILSAARYLGAERDELVLIAQRIATDSIPYTRLRLLKAIASRRNTHAEIAEEINLSRSYSDRLIDDLVRLRVLSRMPGEQKISIASEVLLDAINNSFYGEVSHGDQGLNS